MAVPVQEDSSERRAYDDMAERHGVGYSDETSAGMGKMRLSLVKLGCYVNVHAPLAVSLYEGGDWGS